MNPLDSYIKFNLKELILEIGHVQDSDVISLTGPLMDGMDLVVRKAIEAQSDKKKSLTIILETPGGDLVTVERMVTEIRFHYSHVNVIVPNRAMSAGTIFSLSANKIYMDHFSCLGPIDPQIVKDGQLIPALSYLNQFKRLNKKASSSQLTSVEYSLIHQMDPGELYQFEQAAELSVELAKKWLLQYLLPPSTNGCSSNVNVDRKKLASSIAKKLNKHAKWRIHSRGINMETLQNELQLPVEDLAECENLHKSVREYSDLLRDYTQRLGLTTFVHSYGFS